MQRYLFLELKRHNVESNKLGLETLINPLYLIPKHE